ncbi:MAG TPA: glycogen-binding domain-containing protein [Gemmatimonadaceae bacterium]
MSRSTPIPVARWTTALLLAGTTTARAQIAGAAGVGASLQRDGGGLWQSLTRLEPAAKLTNPWLQLGGSASFVSADRGMQLDNGSLDVVAESPAWNRFRLSSSAQVERHAALPGFSNVGANADAALTYGLSGRGAWVGLGSERSGRVVGSNLSNNADGLLRLGVWQQIGPVVVSLGASEHKAGDASFHPISTPRGDSLNRDSSLAGSSAFLRRWSDTQARVLWSIGRVALDGEFGVQSVDSSHTSTWARGTATVAMGSRLSFVGAFGRQPARAWMGVPGSRFASLGLRIAPASLARPAAPAHVQPTANRFVLHPAESGVYLVTIAVPSARSVEISGDFNSWKPLTLRESRPDVWEATIAIAPGTYHVNMRVNGATWVAPPGLSETSDDFNGSVGLLVVR